MGVEDASRGEQDYISTVVGMSHHRYSPLHDEIDAAFGYSDDEEGYDRPPPGSPPPNNIGNSNGLVPNFSDISPYPRQHPIWFQRAASALGITFERPRGPLGGGTNNDGVFANVTAKPTPPLRVHHGDHISLVPEDTPEEVPPSYASAQADVVPPYWETTVHAPFTPDSMGDLVIDNLPTGSFFSFGWNLLVSLSFQFIGFLLTYLLHTSHAARFGSRAGLGVTLIQYGFALRSRLDSADQVGRAVWVWSGPVDGHWHEHHSGSAQNTAIVSNSTREQATMISNTTTEWLSFFLMTIGWFLLLTSLLGFWRVKRWEKEILVSPGRSAPSSTTNRSPINEHLVSRLESSFGRRGVSRLDLLRQGFGFDRRSSQDVSIREVSRVEEGEADPTLMVGSTDPERAHAIAPALESDSRLRHDLRPAGIW